MTATVARQPSHGNRRTIDAKLYDVNVDEDDVDDPIALLQTLDCPAPDAALIKAR